MDNGASSYRRFLDGDQGAFDTIVEAYSDSLIFFIDRFVHDTAAAEDIAIDVLTELIVHRHRYNFQVSLKTYLFLLGRSRALNYIKHRNKLPMEPLSGAADAPSPGKTPEEVVLDDDRKRAVNNALEKLPEDMRLAVHLVYFEELSYQEAARIMKKNRKQVDNLLYRAKGALRAILGKEGKDLL